MENSPRLGSDSFWEMAALAMEGWLASCQSCVEHYYFQSCSNAVAFLDSCAAGGLVEKVSLLDLKGYIGPRPFPTSWQTWYDQAIYISAPVFRKENLDASRKKIEGTQNAVYNAFYLYYEVLGADDLAIDAAYMNAVDKGDLLRYSEIAKLRQDVALSPVAKLRLIQDAHKKELQDADKDRPEGERLSDGEREKQATEKTTKYILGFSGRRTTPTLVAVSDHIEELDEFVLGFLTDWRDLARFTQKGFKLPSDYHLRLLPVIRELAYYLYDTYRGRDESKAQDFVARVRAEIDEAVRRAAGDEAYVVALSELREDLDDFVAGRRPPVFAPTPDSNRPGAAA